MRPTLLGDLAASLRGIVSQRLLRTVDGNRRPAMEVMVNTKLVQELIERADFSGVREAMENSMAEGSQTFEEDLARLILSGRIERKEGLAYADSPTNLLWRLQNTYAKQEKVSVMPEQKPADNAGPTFTEFTLDVKQN